MKKHIHCPVCEKQTNLDSGNPHRPFCSERCRLIDLGQWIEETYTISEPAQPDSFNIDDEELFSKH